MATRVFGSKDDNNFWIDKPIQQGHPKYKETLQNGNFTPVTKEQASELLKIELPDSHTEDWYVDDFFDGDFERVYMRYEKSGIYISGMIHGDMTKELPYDEFKERLVNTVKG
jgi:hypothetical protein